MVLKVKKSDFRRLSHLNETYPATLEVVFLFLNQEPAAAWTRVALDNLIPMPYIGQKQDGKGPIVKSEWLGGLLNYYYRESETGNGKEETRAA